MAASVHEQLAWTLFYVTVALIVTLLLRRPLQRVFGARIAYSIWMLVLLMIAASLVRELIPSTAAGLTQTSGVDIPAAAAEWISQLGRSGKVLPGWLFVAWFAVAAGFLFVQFFRQRAFVNQLGPLRRDDGDIWIANNGDCGPVVVGAFRPRIVVPADFRERYSAVEQELVLAHERMHVRRVDPLVNLGFEVLRALLWFHPLVHVAARCLRMDQELACDAAVVESQFQCRRSYAETLLKSQLTGPHVSAGVSWRSSSASFLKRRLVMLKNCGPGRRRVVAGVAVMPVILAAVAGLTLLTSANAAPETSPLVFKSLEDLLKGPAGSQPLLLVDGRKASQEEVRSIPMAALERIEVLPADASVLKQYGAGAAHGVVNFVKRR